jgi:hypothetical protein
MRITVERSSWFGCYCSNEKLRKSENLGQRIFETHPGPETLQMPSIALCPNLSWHCASGSVWIAVEKASRTCIPEEMFFSLVSSNFCSPAKSMASSVFSRISFRGKPHDGGINAYILLTVRSGWKPTAGSRKGVILPSTF